MDSKTGGKHKKYFVPCHLRSATHFLIGFYENIITTRGSRLHDIHNEIIPGKLRYIIGTT